MKKVIVIAGKGMAGHMVARYLTETGFETLSLHRGKSVGPGEAFFDATEPQTLIPIAGQFRADFIINCAGILVKASETKPAAAHAVNTEFPHQLEKIFSDSSARIIHLSTDCVFSGKNGNYSENSPKDGHTAYAISKAEGELDNKKDITIRTSIIGPELRSDGTGLLHWFLTQKEPVKGFSKVFWTGITTLELAKKMPELFESDLSGIIHLVPKQKISKYDLLNLINRIWGRQTPLMKDESYQSDKSLVSARADVKIVPQNYEDMLTDLKRWMDSHKELYGQYYR
ncbi:MAG: sugar nucleotide-binding protein [Elusimicrobiaceae bacterium]